MRLGTTIFSLLCFATSYSQSLDGDWMYTPKRGEIYTKHVGFRFMADSLYEISNIGLLRLGKYNLSEGSFSYRVNGVTMSYKLLTKGDTVIMISNSGTKNKYHARRLEYDASLHFDKVTLEGVHSRYGFKRLTISIDQKGNGSFIDHKTNESKSFKVDKKKVNKIDSVFKWSFINSTNYPSIDLDSEIESPFTITIEYNKTKKTSINGNFIQVPYRIRLIYWLLLNELKGILGTGYSQKEAQITIVDIEHINRVGIAKVLHIINRHSPKVVGLDFMLTTDSLAKDKSLKTELSNVRNLVQSTILHNYDQSLNQWDSLETFHSKFGKGKAGFSNFTITDDSVLVPELPMRQYFKNQTVTSLSYAIADNSFGVKTEYKDSRYKYLSFNLDSSFKIISVKDLLSGKFKREDLDGKIVILGDAGSGENNFYLNRQRTKKMSGVEIQANFVKQIIDVD